MLAAAYDTTAPTADWATRRARRPAGTPTGSPTARIDRTGRGGRPSSVPPRRAAPQPEDQSVGCSHQRPRCGLSGDDRLALMQTVVPGGAAPARVPTVPAPPGRSPEEEKGSCGCGGAGRACSCGTATAGRELAAGTTAGSAGTAGTATPVGATASPPVGTRAAATQPHAGDATIVCDGKGGYRVDLGGWRGAPCGIEGCITAHESQHISDWQGRWPDGCKDKPDGGQIPLGGAGYDAFLKSSECKAYTVELSCAQGLLASATGDCKTKVQNHVTDTDSQRKHYCS